MTNNGCPGSGATSPARHAPAAWLGRFLGAIVVLGALCQTGAAADPGGAAPPAQSDRPNVLFIAVDDLNDWIGCLGGHPQTITPNIDRLASRGILFTNAHCAATSCNPSRAAILTGVVPWKTGVWSNESKVNLFKERPQFTVLPKAFSAAGYTTAGTGKLLHSAGANSQMFDRHFNVEQRWSPFGGQAVRYTPEELPTKGTADPRHVITMKDGRTIVLPLNRMPSDRAAKNAGGESFDWGPIDVPDDAMGDTQITNWAIGQLEAGFDDKPFFLGVGYYRPHIPLWAPKKYFDRFAGKRIELPKAPKDDLADLSDTARRWARDPITAGAHDTVVKHDQWQEAVLGYLACINFVDEQIGRLIDAVDAGKFGDNTLIVLWGDHGWHLGEKEHWGKWTGWERSTRVPLIIVPPKRSAALFAKAGSRCDQPVSLIDLYPTLTQVAGVTSPNYLDGTSLLPLLKDPSAKTGRTVVTTFDVGNVSLRSDRWRYIRYADGSEELYDHAVDPNEWKNLSGDAEHTAEVAKFRALIPPEAAGAKQN